MRTIYNNIISNQNLEPKKNIEYIYNLDVAWKNNKEVQVVKYSIVVNVELIDNGSYTFNFKNDPDQIFTCSYGWSFIENTPRNVEMINQIDAEKILLKEQELKIEKLKSSLDWLYGEINNSGTILKTENE